MLNNLNVYFSIIIPVFNEFKNINRTVLRIEEAFKTCGKKYEIIFVDDNSNDGTEEEIIKISKIKKFVKFEQHGKKIGLGAASNYGYSKAKGEIIMQLDGDLAHEPKDLILMYEHMILNNLDMVIGSRYIKNGKQEGKSLIRDLGSRLMNILGGYLLNIKLKDFTHTFRIFKKNLYDAIKERLTEKGHPSYFIELTHLSLSKNFKISEFPVTYSDKDDGSDSKIPIIKESLRYILTILRIYLKKI